MDTLHVKIDSGINKELKRLSKIRQTTVSELIRQASIFASSKDLDLSLIEVILSLD